MNPAPTSPGTAHDPAAGRLPPPVVRSPLSAEGFRRLAERWRAAHLWLSLWNRDAEMVACDEEAGPLWNALRSRTGVFRDALAEFTRRAMDTDNAPTTPSSADDTLDPGPWPEDIGLIAIPVRARRRCIGAVLAAFARSDRPGEDLTRLFNACRLEQAAMEHFLRQAGALSRERIPEVRRLLSLTVEQAREIDAARDEIQILTHNLQNTYEELHLIYGISRHMDIPQQPRFMLQRVGHEIGQITRARGIAFVLSRQEPAPGSMTRPDAPRGSDLEERVIQFGTVAPNLDALDRIANALRDELDEATDHLLLNRAAGRSDLAWAEPWLRHLVALPLRQKDRFLGVLLALNCVDAGDFTSVDVQLLQAVADRVAAALQNQHLYDDLAELLMGLLYALVNSVDAKDPYTFGHSERVAHFSRSLAMAAGLSKVECERVYLSGLLHDVGKIGIPDAILSKTGKLTDEEFTELKKHPEIGHKILSHIRQVRDLLPGVMHHHERMDGRGYPHRLAGRDIPLLGRIICLADSFDAMTSNRTYRAAMPVILAIAEVRRCAGTQFDPVLAERFLGLDLEGLYREAHAYTGGDPNIGRIGALCSVLREHPESW